MILGGEKQIKVYILVTNDLYHLNVGNIGHLRSLWEFCICLVLITNEICLWLFFYTTFEFY